jgi:UDP-2,3-diacylglucosamine pyrophosphatase LpxH
MVDAIIISDIHLGSDVCQAETLDKFLKKIDKLQPKRLIVNGDLFDCLNFNKLPKSHWHILKDLRKLSKHTEVIWINGNHDGHYEYVSNLIGLEFVQEYIFESDDKKVICLHGDRFDSFIQQYPMLTYFADGIYWLMQKIDKTHSLAVYAKKNSKTFLRNSDRIKKEAVKYAKENGADIVCCGHTHFPETTLFDGIWYGNSGCWTDQPCSYLTIMEGAVHLNYL